MESRRCERVVLENDKKRLQKEVTDLQIKLGDANERFQSLKQQVEDSPLAVVRNELANKQLEIISLESKVAQANE